MPASDLYVSRCRIDADDLCAVLRERFAKQSGTAAHIEDFQSGEAGLVSAVATEMADDPVDDVVTADRVEPVDRPEFSIGVPPFLGERRKASDLFWINCLRLRPRSAKAIF